MSGFKLLAIRPLEGCDKKYRKNLQPGKIYQFYHDYKFDIVNESKEDENVTISHDARSVPEDLYDINRAGKPDLKINISAIVGKNGSGKSTILELLYAAMYVVGEEIDDLEQFDDDGLKSAKLELSNATDMLNKHKLDSLRTQEGWASDLNDQLKEILNDKNLNSEKIRFEYVQSLLSNPLIKPVDYQQSEVSWRRKVDSFEHTLNKLKLQVFFVLNNRTYTLHINSSSFKERLVLTYTEDGTEHKVPKHAILKNLFYSIATNYSIYSLNDKNVGEWVNPLFHKNDGYQTPIVINPMRHSGDYKIHLEEHLAKYRFTSNLLGHTKLKSEGIKFFGKEVKYLLFRLAGDKKIRARFTRNKSGYFSSEWSDTLGYKIQRAIYRQFGIDESSLIVDAIKFQDQVENYIINKVEKILWVYSSYRKKYTNSLASKREYVFETVHEQKIDDFVEELYFDDSHITFKLRQAINYLKYPLLEEASNTEFKIKFNERIHKLETWEEGVFVIDIHTAAQKVRANQKFENAVIKKTNQTNIRVKNFELSVINFIPPSIFDLDILFIDENSEVYSFRHLSSGEQQLIHSVQTILYHINNLNSVFNYSYPINSKEYHRISYKAVNIILDEVELYFHPDYQRQFIAFLLENLKLLHIDSNKGVQTINILLATHSPFILSDIPASTVLRLKDGKPFGEPEKETFGANVHDLLYDSFFLEDGFMGKFAEEKIRSLIEFLSSTKKNKRSEWNMKSAKSLIELIGEPYLKQDLFVLYRDKTAKLGMNNSGLTDEEIDEEIRQLTILKQKRNDRNSS